MRSLIIICAITFIISADIKKACTFLRKNAHKKSVGFAGKYVADALQYGGFKFTRQSSSYQYHKNGILRKMGFREIPKGKPKTGDVYVQDKTPSHKHGHIAMFCKQWISDFFQKNDQVFKTDPGAIHYYRFG